MLGGMELSKMLTAVMVYFAMNAAVSQLLVNYMPDVSIFVFNNINYVSIVEISRVMRLAARGGIKGSAVENYK